MKPKISIITVVYNGAAALEPTILSIINQSYSNIEYIVIDGGSTDDTLAIINKYRDKISYFISEPDKGLYDAMNKGMKAATGDYFGFMNAGDLIYSDETLEKIVRSLEFEVHSKDMVTSTNYELRTTNYPDVIYGETEMIDKNGKTIGMRRLKAPENLSWKSLQWGMVVCHQSFIVKKEKCIPFDLHYKIASDINWMIEILKSSNKIHNAHFILSKFKTSGLSYNNIPRALKERFEIMTQNYGLLRTLFNHAIIGTKFLFYVLRHGRF